MFQTAYESYESRVITHRFKADTLFAAMESACGWMKRNDDPVNITVTVDSLPRPMTIGQVEWEVKINVWH